MDSIHDYYAIKVYEADFGFRKQFNVGVRGILIERIYHQIGEIIGRHFKVLETNPALQAAAVEEVVNQMYRNGYMNKLEDILVQEVRRLIAIYTSQ